MTVKEVEGGVIRFIPTDTAIAEMRSQYMALKVNGIDDKEGLKAVHDARMIVKAKRVEVEKKRKELKADALEYGRKVDAEAKRITALLTPIEDHLQHEEDIVTREKERIAAEEAARKAAILKGRMEQLAAVGANVFPTEVQMWTDEDFEAELKTYTDAFNAKKAAEEAERKARAEEAERNRIEAERLAEERRKMEEAQAEQRRLAEIEAEKQRAEKAELDRQRAELEAEKRKVAEEAAERQRAIDEAKRKAEEEEAAKQRAAAMEQARLEAAEKARIETEQRMKREAAEKAERERIAAEKAEQRRLKKEAARPDQEKLKAFAEALRTMAQPSLTDERAAARLSATIGGTVTAILSLAAELGE